MLDLATMKLFFAMLALATNVVVAGYVVLLVARRWSQGAADLLARFHELVDGQEMLYGALVAGTAMFGSLYLSEIANLPPCRLCWWQRYAMYPVAVVLAIGAWRRDSRVRIPVTIAVIVGGAIAAYHYLIQWFPSLEGNSCSITVPCTTAWFQVFGFISIPYMALSGFAFVLVMMLVLRRNERGLTD
ncbi:MAG: disulfide bond formation protein B [Acidimicrobiia bacterium]|nr:disulfide bond formation protein B [Acidimicrobiia bacterium]